MDKKLFSVIIPAYNEQDIIPTCVDYVKKSKGNLIKEIIIVDNNSSDNTYKVAKNLGVKVIKEIRQGVSWARKTGTESASGKYILHIDSDTRLPDYYLVETLKRFKKNSKLVCLGGQMVYYDGPKWKNVARFFIHYYFWLFTLIFSQGRVGPTANNMTFLKSAYDKTIGFKTSLRYGEDIDLTKKLSKFGKVKLDMSLKCMISSRRYKLNKKLFIYVMNLNYMVFFNRPYKNELPRSK